MAGENKEGNETSSVQDIAAMLLTPVKADAAADEAEQEEQEDQSPLEGSEDDELATDDQADDQGEDQGQDASDETSEDEDETEEADEEEDGDQPQIVDISDDDVIDVMIDGKLEQRTIAELKKAAAGEGAIEKRLQEATEARKTAHAERTTILENLAAQEQIVITSLQALNDTVFKPLIPPPPAGLKEKNPAAYLRHKEAYDEDQARIKAGKEAVTTKIKELSTQRATRLKEYGESAAVQIGKLIPELADEAKAPIMLGKLVETAKAYGYTDQEIGSALDPRMFHLVRDAMLYRQLKDRSKEKNVTDLSGQTKKVPRKLRSGNTKAATIARATAQQQTELRKTAAATGKVKDVAALLLKPKGK